MQTDPRHTTAPTATDAISSLPQLCRCYWAGESTVADDEQLCRLFTGLSPDELPAEVRPYQAYFRQLAILRGARLDDAFERRMPALIAAAAGAEVARSGPAEAPAPSGPADVAARIPSGPADEAPSAPVVRARRLSPLSRLLPLLRAAAVVAAVVGLGALLERSWQESDGAGTVVAAADSIITAHPSAPSVAQGSDEVLSCDSLQRL